MINSYLVCKSNHWPPRMKKINLLVNKILHFKKDMYFNNDNNYICNLIFSNDKLIKKMNNKFRKKNYTTDVLTFVSDLKIKSD